MSELNDWNQKVIEEFRANGGKVAQFEKMPVLLLHHKGAKSGKDYVNPLAYLQDGERMVIFASKAGADTNPDWYHNLVTHPDVQIEVGSAEPLAVRATVAESEERDKLFETQVGLVPQFGEYREKTKRTIPVVILERR